MQILDKDSLVKSGLVTKIKQEIRILKFLRHPNVVELKEVMASRQKIYMVMELVPGGELFDKVVAEGPMSVRLPSTTTPLVATCCLVKAQACNDHKVPPHYKDRHH